MAPRIVQTEQTSYLGIPVPDAWLERLSALTDNRGTAASPSLSRESIYTLVFQFPAEVLNVDDSLLQGQGRCHTGPFRPEAWRPWYVTMPACQSPPQRSRSGPAAACRWRGPRFYLRPERLLLEGKAARTGPDGSFKAPGGCSWARLIGCRRAERLHASGVGLDHRQRANDVLPAIKLDRLRTLEGQVIDRQGQAVAGVSVFQPGAHPPVMTNESGRFRLENARPGRSFLLARKEGFRFHGQLIEPISRARSRSR